MNQEEKELIKLFEDINKKGYIKSLRKGCGGAGYTFEKLIGKEEDFEPKPDYKTIEIKTRRVNSNIMTLLNITPESNLKNPMEEILEKLGYPDKTNKNYKRINSNIFANKWNYIGRYSYKKIKLDINYYDKKIYIKSFNYKNEEIIINASWSFDLIKKRVESKLKKLAIINVNSKKNNKEEYFYYKNIELFELKGLDEFIELINNGIIAVELRAFIIKEGEFKGKVKSKGANFFIEYKNIDKLFNKIM